MGYFLYVFLSMLFFFLATLAIEMPLCWVLARERKWLGVCFMGNLATNPLLNGLLGAAAQLGEGWEWSAFWLGELGAIAFEAWLYKLFGMQPKKAALVSFALNVPGLALSLFVRLALS